MGRSKPDRPDELDLRRIVKGTPPPDHWTWLGDGRLWARLLLYEADRKIMLEDYHRQILRAVCKVSTCVNPAHQKLFVRALSEDLYSRGITVDMLNSAKSSSK